MNRYLLDSHIFLWYANSDPALPQRSVEMIRRTKDIYVSAASIWELTLKIAKGKLAERRSLIGLAEEFRFQLLPLKPEHAAAVLTLKDHHCDAFDHLLLVQARVEGLTLVTHDRTLADYGVPILLV